MEMPLMPASSVTPPNTAEHSLRQHWIGVLARARRSDFSAHEPALRDAEYQLIRAPEIGMTLVRGRMGGTGAPFNLGEMSVTRCVVRLADGRTGYSYLAGRDKARAELAALADAHLQGPQQAHWISALIEPLAQAHAARRARQEAETAATKVEFFTLVRGEN
jgi:alpha-D-ribose 1-methylphosphonate 5-triphosphate synthase subunit PhnG